jgi:hypothetical protein
VLCIPLLVQSRHLMQYTRWSVSDHGWLTASGNGMLTARCLLSLRCSGNFCNASSAINQPPQLLREQ